MKLPDRRGVEALVQKDDCFEGEVIDFALPESYGIMRKNGLVVFVPQVIPGEKCLVRLTKIKPNYALGELVEIIEPSPFRKTPPCPHFQEGCGGCRLQFMDYGVQIRVKERNALTILEKIGGIVIDRVEYQGFIPAQNVFEYRNKMEFNFGEREGKLLLGLRPLNRYWDLINLEVCYLMPQTLSAGILAFFRDYGNTSHLSGYDPVRKEGILRNLLVRLSRTSHEVLLGLATVECTLPETERMIEGLRIRFPEVQGVVHIVNNSPASALIFEKKRLLFGKDSFIEKIGNIFYKVSLPSFFQVNTELCTVLYERARDYAELSRREMVLDLYSGSGGIGLFVARYARQVIGVEENPQAVEDAHFNAELNTIDNFHCFSGRVEKVLAFLPHERVDVVIVDPPRAGLDKKVVGKIAHLTPRRVVYVSCNIGTFARDVALLAEKGYMLRKIAFLDLFPQTPHFETVALFQK